MKIDDDGFIEVTIGAATAALDLYAAHNTLLEFDAAVRDALPDGPPAKVANEFQARVAAYLADKFGAVSHRAADKFATAVFGAVADLGKADAPTPG